MTTAVTRLSLAGTALVVAGTLAACSAASAGDDSPAGSAPATTAATAAPQPTASDSAAHSHDPSTITSEPSPDIDDNVDLVAAAVERDGEDLVFHAHVVEIGDAPTPEANGDLDGAPVWSYVWPTSLDSSAVGFESAQGILALAATSHPDFDDTPLYDENADGAADNDGATWHAHWVVLGESDACDAGLAVLDIPEGAEPTLPDTWPGLPLLLDSPDLETWTSDEGAMVRVPAASIGDVDFMFDGVTAGLRVSTSPHDPLLCVEAVWDVASGDLSLPGESPAR